MLSACKLWRKTIIKHFTLSELGAKSEDDFHPNFLKELEILRVAVGMPFNVTSCARTAAYNKKVGGVPRSLHITDKPARTGQLGCMAIDVAVLSRPFKVELIKCALLLGWTVGVNDKKRFVHLDRRVDINLEQTVFTY